MTLPIIEKNHLWANCQKKNNHAFFTESSQQQNPQYLWIGCCDSRVPPEIITQSELGNMLVYRNIANQAIPDEPSIEAILQFAINILHIRKILVVGHYGCGGVDAAMSANTQGSLKKWLTPLTQLYQQKQHLLTNESPEKRANQLCELNIGQQLENIANNQYVKNIWSQQQELTIDGLVYSLTSGELTNLNIQINQRLNPKSSINER